MVWGSSGVRPLYDDAIAHASAFTRDCVPGFDDAGGQAPAFSVFGGKIRTYSRLAEHAIENIMHHFPGLRKAWTGHAVRPGDASQRQSSGPSQGSSSVRLRSSRPRPCGAWRRPLGPKHARSLVAPALSRRSKLGLRTTPEGAERRAASVAPKAEAA